MSSRYTLNVPHPEVLTRIFNLQEIPEIEPRYNISPSQQIATIRQIGDHNKLDFLKWGLITNGDNDKSHAQFNICSETIKDKKVVQNGIAFNRCIIPASGFYEWMPEDTQAYYIRMTDSGIIGFAGIWESWKEEDGTEVETCCILTTEANELVKQIHDRMPVILSPEDYDTWLSRGILEDQELDRLYVPYPADVMIIHSVPDLVNNPRFDSPSCILQM